MSSSSYLEQEDLIQQDQMLLPIVNTIGFGGDVPDGLQVHPSGKYILYPLGATIIIRHLKSGDQVFLDGETDDVSCLAVSPSGRYIASGHTTHMGFDADVVVWDFKTQEVVHRLTIHKVQVKALSFSPSETYLASLGGPDDNTLVVWDLDTGKAVCGTPAAKDSAGEANCVSFFKNSDDQLVSGGKFNLSIWEIDPINRKLRPTDCGLGNLKRIVTCMLVDPSDEFVYCGTTTGDVLKVSLRTTLFKLLGPKNAPFSSGVLSITQDPDGNIIVGTGTGRCTMLKRDTLKIMDRETEFDGAVTSVNMVGSSSAFFVGTDMSNIYLMNSRSFEGELRSTCHPHKINDVAFPHAYSKLFATCSVGDIRLWNANTCEELLRIQVTNNVECNCVGFMKNGKSIISGWADGKIRAFYPESGRLMYVIHDAHVGGVTAIASTSDSKRIISGGTKGGVRVWKITKNSQTMEASMKEHKGQVTSICVRQNDSECVSSSADGSTIIWDLERHVRNKCLFASTFFKSVVYHPDETQVLTTGTDRKLTYWDTFDGSAIREIEGSLAGPINSLDINDDGETFISGGSDKLVKLYNYDEGECLAVGVGHSGEITKVRITPDQSRIVSVSSEGAIFLWDIVY
eukprot:TRINITY_DN1466_c0_g1_i16.p1 TRINITY_DN1466_c0_g1~~TRINITY_DN1466_c0_g1_i16.p1  ORF type:complete len:627 (+),score=198.02 TRINITY_DN1466_c0_g1_i16:1598-3478(+)